ncbi:MAG: signal peptidase I [Pseudomonadota bacterium]
MAEDAKNSNTIWETIKTVFWALVIAGIFRTILFQPFWIPSGSMKDTLLIGDFLFVNKFAYGYSFSSCPNIRLGALNLDAQKLCGFLDRDNRRLFGSEPEQGDIIVFRHPVNGTDYIKRVVGMPGDRVKMTEGVLHLNGAPVQLQPAGIFEETFEPQGPLRRTPRCENGAAGIGGLCQKSRQIETLPNGHAHNILNIGTQGSDNTGVFVVPEGHYFFMGDNRDNSQDSRARVTAQGVGFVPLENLIGRADRVIFSSSGRSMLFFWTWRADRFFYKLQ